MLCTFHHHIVHEGGWRVLAVAEGAFVFRSPIGRLFSPNPPREHVDDVLAWLEEWPAEVSKPKWDGKAPDYALAVAALLEAG